MHKITNRNSKSVEYASLKLGIYFVRNEDHSNEVVFVRWVMMGIYNTPLT